MTTETHAPPATLWRRVIAAYGRLLDHLLVAAVLILIIPVALQIFSRFTAIIPHYIWTEEMARFLFVWTVMIGAMVGVRDSAHFDVDLLPQLGPRAEAIARMCGRMGILAFAIVFLIAGLEFTRFAWNRTSELAELPLWLIHVAWPVAGFTWLVFLGPHLLGDIKTIFGDRS